MIQLLIGELGYPKSLIAVEKELGSLGPCGTDRRIDILCYAPGKGGLRPLLLIECKAEAGNLSAERQVFGYNRAVRAPFIALASKEGIRTFWREQDKIGSVSFLPRFADLLAQL